MDGTVYWLPEKEDLSESVLSLTTGVKDEWFGHPVLLCYRSTRNKSANLCLVGLNLEHRGIPFVVVRLLGFYKTDISFLLAMLPFESL